MNDTRNDTPNPTLEITTPAVRNPGVRVELEPGRVNRCRKENTMSHSWQHIQICKQRDDNNSNEEDG